ncbi:hypothetical protein [Variovorax ginsengisoli]|uniref:Stationary phase growth adaptation protein n=1 Tax=Variovorax ginsengisoli TaxID=363844 RepID=A0ABT9SDJ1_9BURK|nr:hypothetical protein [Variovorax ginsengisoli]MDP9902423.1 hypothetical protein [Variovorax ginsengisoli]
MDPTFIEEHGAIVPDSAYFPSVQFRGDRWDFTHLRPFAMTRVLGSGVKVDVVVFFSCHCFTHKLRDDDRDGADIPEGEFWVDDEGDERVLDEIRYKLSAALPEIIRNFDKGHVRVMTPWQDPRTRRVHKESFFKVAVPKPDGTTDDYVLFFSLDKDRERKRRFILRVKSAYPMAAWTRKMNDAKKVNFLILLNAKNEGREIRR